VLGTRVVLDAGIRRVFLTGRVARRHLMIADSWRLNGAGRVHRQWRIVRRSAVGFCIALDRRGIRVVAGAMLPNLGRMRLAKAVLDRRYVSGIAADGHYRAALFDSFRVILGFVVRKSEADERAHDAASDGAGPNAAQRSQQRAGGQHRTDARNGERGHPEHGARDAPDQGARSRFGTPMVFVRLVVLVRTWVGRHDAHLVAIDSLLEEFANRMLGFIVFPE
jgi:hypothetical protein